mmetsp:Transcript_4744/g.10699  ORF Transcript_4744/g.10699 Transcript_4744/m.10699 type:complete len:109 (+) Transcript_4744:36-362(+)
MCYGQIGDQLPTRFTHKHFCSLRRWEERKTLMCKFHVTQARTSTSNLLQHRHKNQNSVTTHKCQTHTALQFLDTQKSINPQEVIIGSNYEHGVKPSAQCRIVWLFRSL